MNCHIAPYVNAPPEQGNPERNRKLLLHEDEMQRIAGKLTTAGLTLVPLRIHLRNGWIKVQVAAREGQEHPRPPRNHPQARSRPRSPRSPGLGTQGAPVFRPAPARAAGRNHASLRRKEPANGWERRSSDRHAAREGRVECRDPTLDALSVKRILQETARSDEFTGPTPNPLWGYGKVNAFEALMAVRARQRP